MCLEFNYGQRTFLLVEERKEEDRWFFFTLLNPSGEDFDEETQDESLAVPRQVHCRNFRKDTGCGVSGSFVSRSRSRFCNSGKKSNAIVIEDHVPGNCIHGVTSLKGEHILHERFQH